jgi:hypothetical protein
MYMETQNVTKTIQTKQVGNTAVRQEQVTAGTIVDPNEFTIAKASDVLWYFGHLIAVILGLRFAFLALGANLRGIVLFIYTISNVFVLPFRGIFPSPREGEFFFDTAALLGIVMFYLIIFLITSAIALFSKKTDTQV